MAPSLSLLVTICIVLFSLQPPNLMGIMHLAHASVWSGSSADASLPCNGCLTVNHLSKYTMAVLRLEDQQCGVNMMLYWLTL